MRIILITLIVLSASAFAEKKEATLVSLEEHQKWDKQRYENCQKQNKLVSKRLKCYNQTYSERVKLGLHRGTQDYIEIQFPLLSVEQIELEIRKLKQAIKVAPKPQDHLETGQLHSERLELELFFAEKILKQKQSEQPK